jgi:amylovoran biosynthesis glycosyltransferase AmsE
MRHEVRSNFNESQSPRVSVVVNVWGGDEPVFLRRSLSSINSQRQSPDEVVIVVDGPISGELEEEIQSFKNGAMFLVKAVYIQSPKGLWNARNVGIGEAENEIIALHDADDVMHPERLRMQLEYFESIGTDLLGSPVYEFDAISEKILGLRSLSRSHQLRQKMLWQNVINHSSVMFRKSSVVAVGGYRNVHLAEDYDLWLRLICAGNNLCVSDLVLQAFSVDSDLNKRRGGTKFISSEFALHRLVRSTKLQNFLISWVRLTLRLSYRLGPKFSRQIYRSKIQAKKSEKFAINMEEFLNHPPLDINLVS